MARARRRGTSAGICWGLMAAALAGAVMTGAAFADGASDEAGFASLFNGRDLTGWRVEGTSGWTVKDGVISGPGKGFGWLRSDKEYDNFDLKLEFRISPNGNSGVFIRAGTEGRTSRTGMECQILDDAGKSPVRDSTGSLYDMVPPRLIASRPAGEWNEYEIVAKGPYVWVKVNGQLVQNLRVDDPKINQTIEREHAGEKGFPLLKERRRRGYIGLQNHGARVEFRNVRVKPLPESGSF